LRALYNDTDRFCCDWLSNLMDAGLITPGRIDDRSIRDLTPDDVRGYERVHFFAGIGGWDLALDLAGWGSRPVWTGSCPCQPFSPAGAGKAADDERHLWPAWFPLIAQCRPPIVVGEQVEAAIGWGWIDLVFADLEQAGYACGQAVLPAASVGAPHIRYRSYWVADDDARGRAIERTPRLHDRGQFGDDAARRGADGGVVNAERARLEGLRGHGDEAPGWFGARSPRSVAASGDAGFWDNVIWLPGLDGKARPIEPGIEPLAHGVPNYVGQLRAYGNAIVPQLAAAFIRSVME